MRYRHTNILRTVPLVLPQINFFSISASPVHLYNQGQAPRNDAARHSREYFYFIDHQGQLFMDDAKIKNFTSCFKEKKFLQFFFKRLKVNESGLYEEDFPYVSPCGRELNFIRCDDLPVVFTNVIDGDTIADVRLCYGGAGDQLSVAFEPSKLCMLPGTGRIYHPGPHKAGGVGLVKSSIAIELSKHLEFKDHCETHAPIGFTWKGTRYELTNEIIATIELEHARTGVQATEI